MRVSDDMLKHWRAGLHCAHCRQPIAPAVTPTVIRDSAFHPSCARRQDVQQRSAPAATPQTIGAICGIALPFNQQCLVPLGDGRTRSERFLPDAFDASIARGGQTIQIGHSDIPVPGRLQLFTGTDLRFRLRVSDSLFGRATLERAKREEFRGASIRFKALKENWNDRHVTVVEQADLIEISLSTLSQRPAWYGTKVWVE